MRSMALISCVFFLIFFFSNSFGAEVTGHRVISLREIDLVFSEQLLDRRGDNYNNYSLCRTGYSEDALEIWGVWFGEDESVVRLVLSEPMTAGTDYTITFNTPSSLDTIPVPAGYEYSFTAEDLTAPEALSAGFLSSRELEIVFSEDMAEPGGETPGNYALHATGDPSGVIGIGYALFHGVYDRVVLELEDAMVPGRSYTLDISGLHDMAGNALPSGSRIEFTYTSMDEVPRIGLYVDPDRWNTAIDGGVPYAFDMWIWISPGSRGVRSAFFGIDYPFGFSPEAPQYNPEVDWTAFDIYNGGAIGFGDCMTGWTWVCKQTISVGVTGESLIKVFPFSDSWMRQVSVIDCDEPQAVRKMEVSSNIEVNSQDARPIVEEAFFYGERTIDLVFNVPMDGATAGDASNYSVYESSSPGDLIGIDSASLISDGVTVRLTTSEDLSEGTSYTVAISGVERTGGVPVRPGTEVEFTALDVEPPSLVSAKMAGNRQIEVTFSEPVDSISALSLINYTFSAEGLGHFGILRSASMAAGGSVVRFETGGPIGDGADCEITAKGIEDLEGNTMKGLQKASFESLDAYPPRIERVWSMPGDRVRLVFDESPEVSTAGDAENYWISLYNEPSPMNVEVVTVDGDEVVLYIPGGMQDLYPYSVYTRGIEDASGNSDADWTSYRYWFDYTLEDPLPQMGLFADAGRSSGRVDVSPMGFFDVYVWVKPGPGGSVGAEYRLKDISQEDFDFRVIGLDCDPGAGIIFGDPFSGTSIALDECRDDWFWIASYDMLLIDGRGYFELVPTATGHVPQIAVCSAGYPLAQAEVTGRIAVNTRLEKAAATVLGKFSAGFRQGMVQVAWTMDSMEEGVSFVVSRKAGLEDFHDVIEPLIESDGLEFCFMDDSVADGKSHVYRIDYVLDGSRQTLFETEAVETPSRSLALHQNHPNPFNPETKISYYLPERARVRLEIFDVGGRRVRLLEDGVVDGGSHEVFWDGRGGDGSRVSSGIYFYRLKVGEEVFSRKMVLMR